jgi:multiple sugar transport system substrate-binding protein
MIRLKGLVWSHRRGYDPLIATAKTYHAAHPDVHIDWQIMGFHDCYHSSRCEAGSRDFETDLVCFDYPNTGDYAANGWAVPVDEMATSEQMADLVEDADPASYGSYIVNGRLWGLPIDAATIITGYRPDLLGEDASAIPGDWDSLLEVARSFHKPPTRYGLCNQFGNGLGAYLLMEGIVAALGQAPYTEEGATLDRDKAVRALEIVREVHRLSIPGEVQKDHGLGFSFMRNDDRVALTVATFAYGNYAGGQAPRKIKFADMPVMPETGVRTSNIGGVGLAVHSWSKHRDVAWDYAWSVMNRDTQSGTYIENEGQPGRISALRSDQYNDPRDGFGNVLADALHGAYVRPNWPGYHYLEAGSDPVMKRFLAGDLTSDQTITELDRIAAESFAFGGRPGKWEEDELPPWAPAFCWS